MTAFIASLMFVLLAEMGDKTQLLVMTFATRYGAQKALLAVFLATIVNNSLSVLVGHFLTAVIPIDIISLIAALSFIIFGLWTIRGDKHENEDKQESRFGPVLTVGIAFFLAEMGDKTQLATISLAIQYKSMLNVLLGATIGMVIADGFGIVIGVVMKKHIPETTIKWVSAIIFMLFGLMGIYKVLSPRLNQSYICWVIILIIGLCAICLSYYLARSRENAKTGSPIES